ncbi:hypothetical protein [Nocardioides zeae]
MVASSRSARAPALAGHLGLQLLDLAAEPTHLALGRRRGGGRLLLGTALLVQRPLAGLVGTPAGGPRLAQLAAQGGVLRAQPVVLLPRLDPLARQLVLERRDAPLQRAPGLGVLCRDGRVAHLAEAPQGRGVRRLPPRGPHQPQQCGDVDGVVHGEVVDPPVVATVATAAAAVAAAVAAALVRGGGRLQQLGREPVQVGAGHDLGGDPVPEVVVAQGGDDLPAAEPGSALRGERRDLAQRQGQHADVGQHLGAQLHHPGPEGLGQRGGVGARGRHSPSSLVARRRTVGAVA